MSTNCPNCGAPINPYSWRCEYCGTYVFDFSAWDLTDGKPTFVKFKTHYGTITTCAKPEIRTIETSAETTDVADSYGSTLMKYTEHRTCDINVNFSCIPNHKDGSLFRLDINQ